MKKKILVLYFLLSSFFTGNAQITLDQQTIKNLQDAHRNYDPQTIKNLLRDADCAHKPKLDYDPLLVVVLMVKNEESVIKETLQPFVEAGITKEQLAYFIFDTGSTDDTIAVAEKYFEEKNITNFAIKQEPFINFAASRNRGLALAQEAFPKACFMLMPDAEWYMTNVKGLIQFCVDHQHDTCRSYLVRILNTAIDFYTPRLIRCNENVHFVGVVHEVLNQSSHEKVSQDVFFVWDPAALGVEKSRQRWQRDCKLLEEEFECNPHDPRTVFYLAQTYDCLHDWESARQWYELRILMSGWDEENFIARYRLAQVYEKLGDWGKAENEYLAAFAMRPSRAEPLVRLGQHYWDSGQQEAAFLFAQRAAQLPYPKDDILFVEKELYEYTRYDLLGMSAWYTEQQEVGRDAVLKALEYKPDAPHLHDNLACYAQKNIPAPPP